MNLNDYKEQKENIIKRLTEINDSLTDEMIENATKEELLQYIDLVDSITARLETLDMLLEEKESN